MARRYEQPKPARFTAELVDGVEEVRIKARRNWFVLAFLTFWLTGWTIGGAAAIYAFIAQFQLFLLVWLGGWAAGWLVAAATILWQLGGAEILRADGRDLEIAYKIGFFTRRRFYRGSDIRGLSASAPLDVFTRMNGIYPPFLNRMSSGSVRFSYGARTVQAAAGLDEPEARMIVEHLRRRLPAAAVER